MGNKYLLTILLLLTLGLSKAWSQDTIFNITTYPASLAGWTLDNRVIAQNINQSGYWLLDAGNPCDTITSDTYNLSAYTSAAISLEVATYGSGTARPAKIEISYDGGATYTQTFTTSTPASASPYVVVSPVTLSSVSSQVKIRISNNGTSGRGVRIRNILLTASPSLGCTNPSITTQPANRSLVVGGNTTFAVTASNAAGYQWQVNSGSGWSDIVDGGVYSGANTDILTLTSITAALNGNQYRVNVIAASGCTDLLSTARTLTVTSPNALSLSGCAGNTTLPLTWAAPATPAVTGYLVFIIPGATLPTGSLPANANTLTANSDYSLATTYGTQGRLVYKGPGLGVNISELTNGANYSVKVYTYIGETASLYSVANNAGSRITDITIRIPEVNGLNGIGADQSAILNWALPTSVPTACFDEVMVVATTSAGITFNPTGSGSGYIPNSVYAGPNSIVFKAKATGPLNVTGLTNGVTYYFEVYVRQGSIWSPGIEIAVTPYEFNVPVVINEYHNTSGNTEWVELLVLQNNVDLRGWYVRDINTSDNPANNGWCQWTFNNSDSWRSMPAGTIITLVGTGVSANYDISDGIIQTRANVTTNGYTFTYTSTSGPSLNNFQLSGARDGIALYNSLGDKVHGLGHYDSLAYSDITHISSATFYGTIPVESGITDGSSVSFVNTSVLTDFNDPDNTKSKIAVTTPTRGAANDAAQQALIDGLRNQVSFRSAGSGSFFSIYQVWEANNGTGWARSSGIPTYYYNDVTIRSGDSIYFNSASPTPDTRIIDQFTIDEGGVFENGTSGIIDLNNGSGVDFTLNGRFHYGAVSGNSMSFSTGATWLMGSNGRIYKTSSGSAAVLNDNYEGGIINIPPSAHWHIRRISSTNPSMVTIDAFYPNLYFENLTGAAVTLQILSGNSGYATVKGSMYVGVNNDSVTVPNRNYHPNCMVVFGNTEIGAGSVFTNAGSSPNIGTGLDIYGNLDVKGTLTLNNTGRGRLTFKGDFNQTVSGDGAINVDSVNIDKGYQTQVILQRTLEARRQLAFLNGGIIRTTGSNEMHVSDGNVSQSITGFEIANDSGVYNDDKYIVGLLRRRIANGSTATYTFPVGDLPEPAGIGYNPFRLEINSIPNTSSILGTFIHSSPGLINVLREDYTGTCGAPKFFNLLGFTGLGYWKADGPPETEYNIWLHPNVLNVNNNPNFVDEPLGFGANYRALKEDNSKAGLIWNPDVVMEGNYCIISTNYFQIPGFGYEGFSIFAPGGGGTALPVELTSFSAKCAGYNVELAWKTASEFNNDYFTVERSSNGIDFESIGKVWAAGSSSTPLSYFFTDKNAPSSAYYRLKQTDYDGTEETFKIIQTNCDANSNSTQVYFSPGEGIVANISSTKAEMLQITLYDAAGRLFESKQQFVENGVQRFIIDDGSSLAKGLYIVLIQSSTNSIAEKVVLH